MWLALYQHNAFKHPFPLISFALLLYIIVYADKTSPSCEPSISKEVILPSVLVPVTLAVLCCTLISTTLICHVRFKHKDKIALSRQNSKTLVEQLDYVKEKLGDNPCTEEKIEFMKLLKYYFQNNTSCNQSIVRRSQSIPKDMGSMHAQFNPPARMISATNSRAAPPLTALIEIRIAAGNDRVVPDGRSETALPAMAELPADCIDGYIDEQKSNDYAFEMTPTVTNGPTNKSRDGDNSSSFGSNSSEKDVMKTLPNECTKPPAIFTEKHNKEMQLAKESAEVLKLMYEFGMSDPNIKHYIYT